MVQTQNEPRLDRPVKIYTAVIVRYGRKVPVGYLPAFSVDTEQEALDLLVFTCSTNVSGDFIAKELVRERTLDSLDEFSKRLADAYAVMKNRKS